MRFSPEIPDILAPADWYCSGSNYLSPKGIKSLSIHVEGNGAKYFRPHQRIRFVFSPLIFSHFHWKTHASLLLFDTFLPIVHAKKHTNTLMEATVYDVFSSPFSRASVFTNEAFSKRRAFKALLFRKRFRKAPFSSEF